MMADLSCVESALVSAVLAALYPGGPDQVCAAGTPVRVFRGDPVTAALERDLRTDVSNLSVTAVADTTRNTTRWLLMPSESPGVATMSVVSTGTSVTFAGEAGRGQVAGIAADTKTFVYRAAAVDTIASVSAALAMQISAERSCFLSGNTVTIPGCYRLFGRVAADAMVTQDFSRQEQSFCLSVWCATPIARDAVASLVQTSLSTVTFLPLSDGSSGRLRFRSTSSSDSLGAFRAYRRNLIFDVEYSTSVTSPAATMLFADLELDGTPITA